MMKETRREFLGRVVRLAAGGAAVVLSGCVTSPDQLPPAHQKPKPREFPCSCTTYINQQGETAAGVAIRDCVNKGPLKRIDFLRPPDLSCFDGSAEIDCNEVKIGTRVQVKGPCR